MVVLVIKEAIISTLCFAAKSFKLKLYSCFEIIAKIPFLFSGSVGVFSVLEKSGKPMYKATARSGKHTDPVWQVYKLKIFVVQRYTECEIIIFI